MRHVMLALVSTAAILVPAAATAQEVELRAPAPVELKTVGFELTQDAAVRVEAQGLERDREQGGESWTFGRGGRDDDDRLTCYAWLIDARTREPVWVMEADDTRRGDREGLRAIETELELSAGRYELYLYSGHFEFDDDDWAWRSERREREAVTEVLQECHVSVDTGSTLRTFEPDGRFADALIAFTAVGDSELLRQGFELTATSQLRLYGLMEYPRSADEPADFGWIVDLDTGERVWDMSDRRGRRAGGSSKNRLLDRELELPAGRYELLYGTDDSHSAARFNADPPYDPLAWGVQLLPGADFDRSAFRTIESPQRAESLIDFSGVGDDEFREQAFRLTRPAALHVFAIGEGIDDGWTWVDYGWIVDASTRETVWEMDDRNTHPAGGAAKNRMFDGIVRLPAGDYIAFYVSDGSHSAEEWNAAAPFEPQEWGMQIAAADRESAGAFRAIDRDEVARASGLLVDLTRVRDDARESTRFTLDTETEVEVHAVGEGVRDRMVDHGWIRDVDTGRVVWEMDYRDTDHAGGATKNRVQRERLMLGPGTYEAIYETDDSHAFGDWNDRRPDDPLSWGMTVRRID